MSPTRRALLWVTLGSYAVVVAAVWSTSWLVELDWQVMLFRPYKQWPALHAPLDYFVVLGQRGPTAVLIAAWLGWRSWRQRTLRPLLVLATALLLLNVTVGAAKLGMGREGPHYANAIGSNEMFLTGDIFPSGHTANAVVTWGILAYLATTPTARRTLSVIAAVFALSVGATTVYIGTHWVSDVLLGWAAGLLVLLALPSCEPLLAAVEARVLSVRDRLRGIPAGGTPRGTGLSGPRPLPAAVTLHGPCAPDDGAEPADGAQGPGEGTEQEEPQTQDEPAAAVAVRSGAAPAASADARPSGPGQPGRPCPSRGERPARTVGSR